MSKDRFFDGWDCTDNCLEAAEKIAPVFANMILSKFHIHSGGGDPGDAIAKIISDVVQDNVRQAVNEYVEAAVNEIEIFPTTDHAVFILRSVSTRGDDDPLVREISVDAIKSQLDTHDPDNAEKLVDALANRLEELAAELRKSKGTFGWR